MVYLSHSTWKTKNGRVKYHHLLADSKSELHEFAAKANINKCWYSVKPVPHYDVNEKFVPSLLQLGAQWVTRREEALKVKELRLTLAK